ncbi:MAG: hypothetical protein KDA21_11885 [Phycisphaerales bacterium]|nr:hypothetical protein [Phycisphaerales bacterium]
MAQVHRECEEKDMKPFVLTAAVFGVVSGMAATASAEVDWNMSYNAMNTSDQVVATYTLGVPNPIHVSLEMTNFTGVDWIGLDFEILMSAYESYAPGEFAMIHFDETAPRSTTISPASEDLTPDLQRLMFSFPMARFDAGETHTFTFTILNPDIQLFDLAIRPIVPTPGAISLAGVGLAMGVRRRRR